MMQGHPVISNQGERPASIASPRILIPFLLVTLIWGTTWIVIKDQLGVVPAGWSVAYRFLLGATVMFIVARFQREKLLLSRNALLFVSLFGIAQFTLNFNFVYQAERYVTSGLVAVVFALLFVPNAIFGRFVLGHTVSGRFLAGSAIALLGLVLLFVQEAQGDAANRQATLAGIGFTLTGVLCASAANVMQASDTARRQSMPVMLAWGMLVGGLLDAALAWSLHGPPVIEPRLGYVMGIGYLAIFGSALSFTLYFGVIRAIGPAKAAYSSVLIPVIAMAISTFAEEYQWTPLSIGGSLVAMIGMLVALSSKR